ncbi:MAG TPA: hypothetical protein VGC50_15255 [Gammaproteobacteria bacterium]
MKRITWILASGLALLVAAPFASAQDMSFFVTSVGSGNGGNLGGIEGADAHCQALAEEAGASDKTWHAYLSTERPDGRGVSARTRIGPGPWYNADGVMIANDLDELHISPNLRKATALTENGDVVNGFGDSPNVHDVLTGTMDDGTAFFPDDTDHTCNNWTNSGEGSAQVGHTDRMGGGNVSWNAAHASRGCSQEALVSTGGAGLFYCFAID